MSNSNREPLISNLSVPDLESATDPYADFSLAFSGIEIQKPEMSAAELRQLHQVFLSTMGAST